MAAPHAAQYHRPADWKQFERLSIALMSRVFGERFDQYGREGQRQDGVDLYCRMRDGTLVAVQCKGRNENLGKKLTVAQLNQAVRDTASFPFKIDRFFVLTTSPHDTALTNRALELSAQRGVLGESTVEVWGWESLENIIREEPSLQDSFYSEYKPKISLLGWAFRAAFVCSLAVAVVIGLHRYQAFQQDIAQTSEATVAGLSEYMSLNDQLIDTYGECLNKLDKEILTFSFAFEQSCVAPVEKTLTAMEHQVQQASLKIDAEAIAQLNVLLGLLREDFRQGLIANQMVTIFEDGLVQSQKALCIPNNSEGAAEILRGMREPANAAMTHQLEYYFVLRDFILPGLKSMQSNVLVAARRSSQRDVSDQMLSDARELSTLLTKRDHYQMKDQKQPFTLSKVKYLSSRDITVSGDMDTMVEDARYGDVLRQGIQSSLFGRHDVVQELIDCGIFVKGADAIIQQEEDAIRASAVRS